MASIDFSILMNYCSEHEHLHLIISPILKVTKLTESRMVYSRSEWASAAAVLEIVRREWISLLRYLKVYWLAI